MILFAGSSWVNRPRAVKTGYDMTPDGTRATLKPYAERPGWSGIRAIREGRVAAIEHGLARTLADFAAMQFIAKQLHPSAFADVDRKPPSGLSTKNTCRCPLAGPGWRR